MSTLKHTAIDSDNTQDNAAKSLLYGPFRLLTRPLHSLWLSFRPYLPQLVPLAVFLVSIPVLLFFSVSAGWFVWRSIAVGWEVDVDLQYGDGPAPYAHVHLPSLATLQPYDVSLHLVVPASRPNLELGNFMTSLALRGPTNESIADVRKPALVHPARLSTFFLFSQNTLTLDIPLLSRVVFRASSAHAVLEVGRRDHWRGLGQGEGRELSVARAVLRGVVVHRGLRGLATRFPVLTALTASGAFFFIAFVMMASCLLPMIEWRLQSHTDDIDAAPAPHSRGATVSASASGQGGQGAKRVKREASVPAVSRVPRAKRSRSLGTAISQRNVVKAEETSDVQSTPSSVSSTATTPLRRRRSRVLQSDQE